MNDVSEAVSATMSDARDAIDEIAHAARVLLRAQNAIDRRLALDRLDAARTRLDARLAALRGELVRIVARDADEA